MTTWDEDVLVVLQMTPAAQNMSRMLGAGAFAAAGGVNPTTTGMIASGTLVERTGSGASQRLTAAMQAERPWLAATIRADLTVEAVRRGIKVTPLPMPTDAKEQLLRNQALNYSEASTPLVLEVSPAWVGYVRSGGNFVPSAEISVTYMTRNHEMFYIQWFTYGAAVSGVAGTRIIAIEADRKYFFATEEALFANIPLAASGIRAAAAPITKSVIASLMST
jgi:hypothetical protein